MPRGCVSPLLPPRALQFQYAQFSFFLPARCSGGGGGRGRREGDGGDFLSEFWRMGAQPNAERDRELSKPSKNLILDVRSSSTPNIEEVSSVHTAGSHGFEEAVEFKPVEHPSEPIVYDQPIACPLPEPSIINDGRIWKQRRTSTARRAKADLPVVKDASGLESRDGSKPTPNPAKLHISSSLSAPEYSIISLLEECNSFQDRL